MVDYITIGTVDHKCIWTQRQNNYVGKHIRLLVDIHFCSRSMTMAVVADQISTVNICGLAI